MTLMLKLSDFEPEEGTKSLSEPESFESGNAPTFNTKKRVLWGGWYLWELVLEHDDPSAFATLLIDYGLGFEEEQAHTLVAPSGTLVKRLCFFPRKPVRIRFEPLESAGQFRVAYFRLRWVPFVLARRSIVRLLRQHHHDFIHKSAPEVKRTLAERAKRMGVNPKVILRRYYNAAFGGVKRRIKYLDWIKRTEKPRPELQQEAEEFLAEHAVGPVISVVMPVYNPPVDCLKSCIESVLSQVYPNWQLCIADDASTDPAIAECLRRYAAQDARIEVAFRERNGHIVQASNSALSLVKGEYVALLDHDDCLAPQALLRVAQKILADPEVKLIYSDEDKINRLSLRANPHFKPDWNPDLLLGQNYISHLTVLKTQLVHGVGGFREGTEGSQDHDLLLRCLPHLSSQTVAHIPEVLYHWRTIAGSTASAAGEKDYTVLAGLKAVQDYLSAYHPGAKAELSANNTYRVIWAVPAPEPKVSLLVPTRNGVDILKPCVDAILENTNYTNFEVLILDNQSNCPETLAYFDRISCDPRVSVHRWDHEFNFSAINNFGASLATGEILGLINNDVEPINADWLREMVSQACRPEIGCVGAKLYYPNETLQHGGIILGIGGVAGHSHKYVPRGDPGYFSRLTLVQNLSAVTAACLLVKKSVFDQVDGLDEANLAIAFNDVDFCLKVRTAGYRNLWTPFAELYHHESVSRGAEDSPEKLKRFAREKAIMVQRWGEVLARDPAYNTNLSRSREDFSIEA